MRNFEDQFRLESGAPGIYSRSIDPSWGNGAGRIFGGYSAGLALAAAAAVSPHPELCSFHVLFLEAVAEGLITFEVNTLRLGRAVAAMQVVGLQNGRKVICCQAWLRPVALAPAEPETEPGALAGAGKGTDPNDDPEQAVSLPWFAEIYEFHEWMETRVVDYAWSLEESLTDGDERTVDLWSRLRHGTASPGFYTQLYDVIMADAHIASARTRASSSDPRRVLSLDLSMQWVPVSPRMGWRRMQAYSPPGGGVFAACTATLFDRNGALCATASQQTLTVPLPPGL